MMPEYIVEQIRVLLYAAEEEAPIPGDPDSFQYELYIARWCVKEYLAYQPQMPQPRWDDAPEWAQWWAVDANGWAAWHKAEPYCDSDEGACWCGQPDEDGKLDDGQFDKRIDLPLGIDWRQTLQRRPEPQS